MSKCKTFKDFEKSHKNRIPKTFNEEYDMEVDVSDEKSKLTFVFDTNGVEVVGRTCHEDTIAFFSGALVKALGVILKNEFPFVQRIAMLTTWQVQIEKLMRECIKNDDIDFDDEECDD